MIKQNIKIILILAFICAEFFCFGKNCWATVDYVVINEVYYDPTGADTGKEWIELYNNGDQDVGLSGWVLEWGGKSFDYGNFVLSGIIPAKKYFLIGGSQVEAEFGVTPDLNSTLMPDFLEKLNFQNGGTATDGIRIFDGSKYYDTVLYDTPNNNNLTGDDADPGQELCPDVSAGYSLSRVNTGIDNNLSSDWERVKNPTPQNSNSPPEQPSDEVDNGNGDDSDNGIDDGEEEEEDEQQEEQEQEETPEEKITETYKLGDVVINEFVSDPADEDVEWIELYNTTNKEINLESWTIEEGSGAKTTLEGVMGSSNENKFFVIEKPKGNLNNKGDIIILRDDYGTLIDQVTYGNWDDGNTENNAPVASDPYGVARKFDGQNSFNNDNDFAITATLTKGTSNIITKTEEEQELVDDISAEEKALYNYSKDIIISEVFPNPFGSDSEDEFIELYNKGERDVDLLGWRLGDESKKKYKFKYANDANLRQETPIIKASEYLVIYRSESKIALNNGNDSVKLYQPLKDEPCQVVEYEKAIEGWSYVNTQIATNLEQIATNNKWVWSEVMTPGVINIIKTINHPPIVDFDCPEEVLVGAPVIFDSSDTVDEDGDELKFSWDFGDSATNTLAIAEHTFFKQGAWTVKLTVSDGENEVEKERIIKVVGDLNMDGVETTGLLRHSVPLSLHSIPRNDNVIINEFLPNPKGADAEGEFIELYNQGSDNVNLINWKVDDSEGGSKPYTFDIDLWLNSGMYYVLGREESGLALNNTTDAVRLFDNFNELVEEIEYEKAVEGEAYARGKNNKWFWTTVITPGEENIISVAESNASKVIVKSASYDKNTKKVKQIIQTTLEKIQECEVGDLVKVTGVVAVKPGVLGSQYFYIVSLTPNPSPARSSRERGAKERVKIASVDFVPDGTVTSESPSPALREERGSGDGAVVGSAGIQVYNYKKDFPNLKVGDYIEVQGELSISSGERRLKTKTQDDFKILEHREPPVANEATCEKIDEECVGQLITVTGEVVERKSSIVYLDDGTDEVIVYIKTATGINPKSIKEGETVAVAGLVGRTKSGIRIMPRSSDDIIKKDPQSHSGKVGQVLGEVAISDVWEIAQRDKKIELFQYLLILASGVIVVLGGLLVKEARKG